MECEDNNEKQAVVQCGGKNLIYGDQHRCKPGLVKGGIRETPRELTHEQNKRTDNR